MIQIQITEQQARKLRHGGMQLQLDMLKAANHERNPIAQRRLWDEARDLDDAIGVIDSALNAEAQEAHNGR